MIKLKQHSLGLTVDCANIAKMRIETELGPSQLSANFSQSELLQLPKCVLFHMFTMSFYEKTSRL